MSSDDARFYRVNVWELNDDGVWHFYGVKYIHHKIGLRSAHYKVAGELGRPKEEIRVHTIDERGPS